MGKAKTKQMPLCIYATKDRAKEAEGRARHEIAAVLEKYGVLGAIIVIGMAHRQPDGEILMNVGIEGSGNPDHVYKMSADILRPGLFDTSTGTDVRGAQ